MAQYTEHYDNLAERQANITTAEDNGYTMLHDDFDPDWQPGDEPHGTLTFDNTPTPPPSADQLLMMELAEKANDYHTKGIQAYNNWSSLTQAQKSIILKEVLGAVLSILERLGYYTVE